MLTCLIILCGSSTLSSVINVKAQSGIDVTVHIIRFTQIQNPDPGFPSGDYFATVTIDGTGFQTGTLTHADFYPNWNFRRSFASPRQIIITIRITDSDTFVDDVMDINPTD